MLEKFSIWKGYSGTYSMIRLFYCFKVKMSVVSSLRVISDQMAYEGAVQGMTIKIREALRR